METESSPVSLAPVNTADSHDLPIIPICAGQVDIPLPKPFFDVISALPPQRIPLLKLELPVF